MTRRTGRFVAAWSVNRGVSGITQALDASGTVWERHTVGEKVDGAWVTKESWWEPLNMTRRTLVADTQ